MLTPSSFIRRDPYSPLETQPVYQRRVVYTLSELFSYSYGVIVNQLQSSSNRTISEAFIYEKDWRLATLRGALQFFSPRQGQTLFYQVKRRSLWPGLSECLLPETSTTRPL